MLKHKKGLQRWATEIPRWRDMDTSVGTWGSAATWGKSETAAYIDRPSAVASPAAQSFGHHIYMPSTHLHIVYTLTHWILRKTLLGQFYLTPLPCGLSTGTEWLPNISNITQLLASEWRVEARQSSSENQAPWPLNNTASLCLLHIWSLYVHF